MIKAFTITLPASQTSSQNLWSSGTPPEGPMKLRIRTTGSAVYIGDSALDDSTLPSSGFLLVANQEYIFDIMEIPYVINSAGSSADISVLWVGRV
jgi:hypothetical protein